ncbi:arsenite efflux transporter metallochaperone ArsD [Alkaliphilus peptidifermentans]|uniref:Arsenical resistance operon trans-acting repressor ArsD n=1 Tax=Alkaliphilus peptidifermentans DSM 18978 TaxID=1120976 RepID=A0A1G5AKL6_9FIRM|nr:arsenite efflux transporter metallochaperone ArsD [Alkaliphilus peptidifermentans]SCX78401.1 Arsenical resistance operon trans-acting repressor ArsD [Alkaliphilus peptidifermentans DSM 18978]
MKIEFFDPPMCCSSGICGPSVDEKLIKVSENIDTLKRKYEGISIERYMISQQPLKFRDNEEVFRLVKEKGREVLPITTVNGRIIKVNEYPSLEELEKEIGAE